MKMLLYIKFEYSEKATKFEKIFHVKFDITESVMPLAGVQGSPPGIWEFSWPYYDQGGRLWHLCELCQILSGRFSQILWPSQNIRTLLWKMSQRINVSDFVVLGTKLLERNLYPEFSITLEDVWWILIRRKFCRQCTLMDIWRFGCVYVHDYPITYLSMYVQNRKNFWSRILTLFSKFEM